MMSAVSDAAGINPAAGAGEQALPVLREDLDLYPGPRNQDGSPTWTLHDPARNLFFRIGWLEFEILSRWDNRSADKLVQQVNRETTLQIEISHVEALARFLISSQLVESRGKEAIRRLCQQAAAAKKHFSSWLLHNYLFFRIPLVRPHRFLAGSYRFVRFVYTRPFAYSVFACLALGLFLVSRQWDDFAHSFSYLFSFQGLVLFAVAIFFTKVIHELGHAYTAVRYGVKVPSMGLAFLVLWPVLYTDTSEAWKLSSRRQRLAIAAAGITAELVLAVFATLLWSFLPDGELRSAVFIIATTTWVITLLINVNPMMRFDGYYLLSDLLEIQNLQDRSFALGKWRLRNWLFGLDEPCPEILSDRTRRFMIVYAYCTWTYRFFLFLGIALLVYTLFFKVAGIILLFAELGWFIARPVYRELKEWYGRREQMVWNRHSIITALLLGALVALLVFPWNVHLYLPAVMQAREHANLYAPFPAVIDEVLIAEGDRVEQDQVLINLASPEITYRIEQAELRVNILRQQLSRRLGQAGFREDSAVLQERLAQALTEYQGYRLQQEQLAIRAPIAGRLVDMESDLEAGRWINEKLLLVRLIQQDKSLVEAYIDEDGLGRVRVGADGRFYPENPDLDPVPVRVSHIDPVNTRELDKPYLASLYGGAIGVQPGSNGELFTADSLYRVRLEPLMPGATVEQPTRGSVRLGADARSLLSRFWQKTGAVLIRESGF
ncbi:MAG: site-2 protease family protein [Gammaproteobacteria bacterium]